MTATAVYLAVWMTNVVRCSINKCHSLKHMQRFI
jgi:hypothetical protein